MELARARYLPLDQKGGRILADTLGDTPETVISVHLLKRGFCHAYVAGEPSCFDGAIVQDHFCPAEPIGFGLDPEALWALLQSVHGWDCVNVTPECETALGEIIEAKTGRDVRYYGDIYFTLSKPVSNFKSEVVRQLILADLDLLESAPTEVQGSGFESPSDLLTNGIVACAIVSGGIVSIAHTYARSDRHADIGVSTLKAWRGHGFATAAASIVAGRVQEAGQTPVWSTGEDNFASRRIAQKLGFTQVSQRTYVILRNA